MTRRRTSRRIRPNDPTPKGFPWPRNQVLYHTTVALDRVRDEGLKPRRALSRDVHATGGGPDESISFTTDERVAIAIAVGLRVLVRAARGSMQLGQLIIEMERVAPKGLAEQLRSMKLTPETVVHADSGLVPFSAGFGAWRNVVSIEAFLDTPRSDLVDVKESYAGGTKPMRVEGWTTPATLRSMQERSQRPGTSYFVAEGTDRYAANLMFELYKYALSYAEYNRELYNPLFIHTSPEVMRTIEEDQIGIVEATIDADWICAEAPDADRLGYDVSRLSAVTLSDWAHGCENRLRFGHKVQTKPREWEQPEPHDTVTYAGSMAEVRVFDPAMIRGLRMTADVETFMNDTRDAWDRKGMIVDDPVGYPYFKVRHSQLARSW